MRVAGILIFVSMLSTQAIASENWPQFRGPSGDGHSASKRLPVAWSETENVRWKTAIHDRGWSSPVVWNNQIWLTTATADGKQMFAVCIDHKTGRIIHDVKLFENDEPREIHNTNTYASPTPVIEQGRVYIHFGSYGTACLDSQTAKVLWTRRDLPCHHWRGPGSSPILFEDLMIVHYDGFDFQYIVALNKKTGKTVWKKDRDVDYGTKNGDIMKAYCTPIIIKVNNRSQLISPTSKATLAYDPRTGAEKWRVRYKSFSATARPLFGHGMLFINTGFGKADLIAVRPTGRGDVTDSHVVWTAKKSIGSKSSQLLVDDLIYNVHDKGVATCMEAQTGKVVWTQRWQGQFSSSPIYVDSRIYFFNHEGKAWVIAPGREYNEIAVNTLDKGCRASPAIVGKALLVRTATHLYRLERP